jgi:hypothetical protein
MLGLAKPAKTGVNALMQLDPTYNANSGMRSARAAASIRSS